MKNAQTTQLSKFLSLVLRHKPEVIDIQLNPQGWVDVDTLLEKCRAYGKVIDRSTLQTIIDQNNKKRFILSEDGRQIRANQGHSLPVVLDYPPVVPPTQLYHGTAARFLESILSQGLLKQKRHHVHLSGDLNTASQVGRRHGKLVLLTIDAIQMYRDGYRFYKTPNEVWLTDHVPPSYLQETSSVL